MKFRRCLPLMVLLAAGLMAAGCGGGKDKPAGGSGGTGGDGGTGGTGGAGTCNLDGNLDAGEACDDGNTVDTDCCSNSCQVVTPTCGNGTKECGEECDDGNTNGDDACSEICKEPRCGNGYPETGEECDDANTESGDGCSAECKIECARDQECDAAAGEICSKATADARYGSCTAPGAFCNTDSNCRTVDPVRCPGSESCYCKESDAADPMYGVCWQRVPSCGSCETDADCGASQMFDRPAMCVTYHYSGVGEQKVCLPKNLPARTCPPGFVAGAVDDGGLDMTGLCVPQSRSCPVEKCAEDKDCPDPAFPVCDLAREICIPGCYINYEQNLETIGCSPGKPACHAMPERLDPNLLNDCATAPMYGFGKCGVECETNLDCEHRGDDVNGNPYVCKNDGGVKRCRPSGCLDDMECPEPSGSEYLGYCDPFKQACTWDNCRQGNDPRAGCGVNDPYIDCATTHKCVADEVTPEDGYGICVLKNCIDNGGAMLDCKGGQFCAGEPMIDMMTGLESTLDGPLPPPQDVPIGVCYDMDVNLYCGTGCTPGDNSTCNGAGMPGRHPDDNPGYCMPTQAGGQCYFGCRYQAECPGMWMCSSQSLTVATALPAAGLKVCEDNFDCGTGNECVDPFVNGELYDLWPEATDPDGILHRAAPFKVCSCTNTGTCGGGAVCNEGIGSRSLTNPTTPVHRYCTVGAAELCGPTGTLEWWGEWSQDQDLNFFPTFNCSCGPGSNATCPVPGPQGTVMQTEATHCGMNMRDRMLCVGGQVCEPMLFAPEPGADPACIIQP